MAEVKIPGIGNVDRKWLIGGALIGAAAGIIIWVRRRNAAATAPTAAADTTGTAGTGYDPNLDPATGYDYGTAADQAALSAQGQYDPYAGSGGLYGSGGLPPIDITLTQTPTKTPGPKPVTEAEWISQAASLLHSEAGVGRAAAAEALTEWVAGQTITAQQAQYVREALALNGNPPNGAPPIHLHHGHSGGPGKTKVKVPNVTGKNGTQARNELAAHHLKDRVQPGWKATSYVLRQSPAAGAEVDEGSTVTLYWSGV